MPPVVDLEGRRFGKLFVVESIIDEREVHQHWMCFCDCGKVTKVFTVNLTSGATRSCGCEQMEGLRRHWARKSRHMESV